MAFGKDNTVSECVAAADIMGTIPSPFDHWIGGCIFLPKSLCSEKDLAFNFCIDGIHHCFHLVGLKS